MDAIEQIGRLWEFDPDGRMVPTDRERLEHATARGLERWDALDWGSRRTVAVGAMILGDHDRARRLLRGLADQADGDARRVAVLVNLADAHRLDGDVAGAEAPMREALALAEGLSRRLWAFAAQHWGKFLIDAGRPEEAVKVLEEVLRVRRGEGEADLVASTELALAVARKR
ncbi:tetratricopeptide repeat protein [Salininema proteolyticum]|uniref:Tetratricopeptide repeat protein n=1 Tax=Salininema proteolyticum TaxID=1607685 RepID=A0ABV8TUR9_9ACTN